MDPEHCPYSKPDLLTRLQERGVDVFDYMQNQFISSIINPTASQGPPVYWHSWIEIRHRLSRPDSLAQRHANAVLKWGSIGLKQIRGYARTCRCHHQRLHQRRRRSVANYNLSVAASITAST